MGFLNPFWLLGVASAGIPLVIHLIGRRRESNVDFPSLRLLREVDRRRNLWLRLKRILLLLLRMAICASLFLVLARPVVNLRFGLFAHAPTGAYILVDDSPSMTAHDGQVFSLAKERTAEIAGQFHERDEIFVLTTSGQAELGPSSDRQVVRDFIRNLAVSHTPPSFESALRKIEELVSSSKKVNRAVYLISDLQAEGYRQVKKQELDNVVVVDVGRDVENVSVKDVVTEGFSSTRGLSTLRVVLTNHSTTGLVRHIGVWLDGEKLQVSEVTLPPKSDVAVELEILAKGSGSHSGHIRLMEDDDLLFDNVRYFALQVPAEVRVLIIDDDGGDAVYLVKALRPEPEVLTPFSVEVVSPRRMPTRDLLSYDVVALNDVAHLEFGQLKMLQKHFERGGRACFFLGDQAEVDFYNTVLLPEFESHADPSVAIGSPNFLTLGNVDFTHPLFSLFREKRSGDLSLSKFYHYTPLETLPGQVLARFSNGKPAVVESLVRGIILTFSLAQSDMPKRAIFVPFIHRLFYYLARKEEVPQGILVGERFKMETAQPLRIAEGVMPGGERFRIVPKTLSGQTVITFAETHEPGIYGISADDSLLTLFPVNIDPVESQTERISPEELGARFGHGYSLLETADATVRSGLHSFELTKVILWCLLGLLFLEILIAHRR